MPSTPGLIIAAPASGSGKTAITLALLRHLRNAGRRVSSAKVGPDYIDPQFHALASGRTCRTLDPWGMRPETLIGNGLAAAREADRLVVEGVMGLFDGAADGTGSTADLAARLQLPVVLVVDVAGQAQSAAATVSGFERFRDDVTVAGVIFNRVGGGRHAAMLREAVAPLRIPVLACIPRTAELEMPDRHLGLVQPCERDDIEEFLERAARVVGRHLDEAAFRDLAVVPSGLPGLDRREAAVLSGLPPSEGGIEGGRARGSESTPSGPPSQGGRGLAALQPQPPLSPLGRRIAVARDRAFSFVYPHILEVWQQAGAAILPFSPLADEPPDKTADAVYLPGGYPELHAEQISGNRRFLNGLRRAADRGACIYGECGGYMVLGETLIDSRGRPFPMAGLLPVQTSFARRRLHLGYRRMQLLDDGPLGRAGAVFRGHEFHYSSVVKENGADALFRATDSRGENPADVGLRRENIMGSFLHLIDAWDGWGASTSANSQTDNLLSSR